MKESVEQLSHRLGLALPTNHQENIQFLSKILILAPDGNVTTTESIALRRHSDAIIRKQRDELKNLSGKE